MKQKNENERAFQCLNQALTIDPENVDAYVARGSFYASNLTDYKLAVQDLEKAHSIDENHRNVKDYLSKVLVAYGKQFEEKKWPLGGWTTLPKISICLGRKVGDGQRFTHEGYRQEAQE